MDNDGRCSNASSLCFFVSRSPNTNEAVSRASIHLLVASHVRGTIPGWCVLNHRCSNTARAYIGPLIGRSQLDSRLPGPLCLPRQIGTYDDDDDDDVDTLQVMSYQCKAGPIYTTPSMAPPCSISHPSQLASVPNHRRIISSSPH